MLLSLCRFPLGCFFGAMGVRRHCDRQTGRASNAIGISHKCLYYQTPHTPSCGCDLEPICLKVPCPSHPPHGRKQLKFKHMNSSNNDTTFALVIARVVCYYHQYRGMSHTHHAQRWEGACTTHAHTCACGAKYACGGRRARWLHMYHDGSWCRGVRMRLVFDV